MPKQFMIHGNNICFVSINCVLLWGLFARPILYIYIVKWEYFVRRAAPVPLQQHRANICHTLFYFYCKSVSLFSSSSNTKPFDFIMHDFYLGLISRSGIKDIGLGVVQCKTVGSFFRSRILSNPHMLHMFHEITAGRNCRSCKLFSGKKRRQRKRLLVKSIPQCPKGLQ